MTTEQAIHLLSNHLEVFKALLQDVPNEQVRWKPAPDTWSILEVINHLYDEERDDFRTRFRLVLEDPTQSWPPIDPPRWAIERKYNERELQTSLDNFVKERENSLEWLSSLIAPRLENTAKHPGGFTLSAGDLLASWVAHDLLHIRQMTRLKYQYLAEQVKPYQIGYAGDWY